MIRILLIIATMAISTAAYPDAVLIENVCIFNGVDDSSRGRHALIDRGLIRSVFELPIDAPDRASPSCP